MPLMNPLRSFLRPVFLLTLQAFSVPLFALDASRLEAIGPAMQEAVRAKQAAGIVTLVLQDGKVIHHGAAGMADAQKGRPMDENALFWIASMTKSVNATALMLLVDEGKLALDTPASQWLPELGKMKLQNGESPKTPITLRMLLSHTAGIAFPPRKATDGAISLKTYVASLVKAPLAFEPGTSYEYGFGPTVAGRILEIVSGMKYEDFLRTRLFEPLGMKDTLFHPDDARRARIARTYKLDEETRELVPGYNPFVTSDASVTHMVEPSGGLFSTAADLGRFYAMIAGGGILDGTRILSEKSVQEMTRPVSTGTQTRPYAAGWQVNLDTEKPSALMPAGSFGHGGAFATNGWVVPSHRLVTVYLVQNVLVPDSGKPKDTFHRLVLESLGIQPATPAPPKPRK
jgi:CubicO group peptidase (beta-lactamase class C family)